MKRIQQGFSLVTAIFLIVVLAALGVFAASLLGMQQTTAALDTLGARALQAADAGIEWGAWQALRAGNCPAASHLALPGSLAAFTVSVNCEQTDHDEAGTTVLIDRLVATACNQPAAGACPNPAPGPDYVERRVETLVEQ